MVMADWLLAISDELALTTECGNWPVVLSMSYVDWSVMACTDFILASNSPSHTMVVNVISSGQIDTRCC